MSIKQQSERHFSMANILLSDKNLNHPLKTLIVQDFNGFEIFRAYFSRCSLIPPWIKSVKKIIEMKR